MTLNPHLGAYGSSHPRVKPEGTVPQAEFGSDQGISEYGRNLTWEKLLGKAGRVEEILVVAASAIGKEGDAIKRNCTSRLSRSWALIGFDDCERKKS